MKGRTGLGLGGAVGGVLTWASITFFSPAEFDSPDAPGSGEKYMNLTHVERLDLVRQKRGKAIIITSGYRTASHNDSVGGVSDSEHTRGYGTDCYAPTSRDRYELVKYGLEVGFERIGIGSNFVHFGSDPEKPKQVIWLY